MLAVLKKFQYATFDKYYRLLLLCLCFAASESYCDWIFYLRTTFPHNITIATVKELTAEFAPQNDNKTSYCLLKQDILRLICKRLGDWNTSEVVHVAIRCDKLGSPVIVAQSSESLLNGSKPIINV